MPMSSASVRSPLDHHMAELVGKRDEIAFRIDDALLHPGRGLFQQTAKQMRLAGAGIALHEETRRQKLFDIERGRSPFGRRSHVDADFHPYLIFAD